MKYLLVLLILLLLTALLVCVEVWRRTQRHNRRLAEQCRQLETLNATLAATNEWREQYVCLFIDLCATYIGKFSDYRHLVRTKVMEHKIGDLLKPSLERSNEAEMRKIHRTFDKAFLRFFPDFVERFNDLLRDGEHIVLRPGELLNTELRIFGLIRMGFTDSSKIATLLFYSPQTIYNYRTAVRNKAKDRDTFEAQVARLCSLHRLQPDEAAASPCAVAGREGAATPPSPSSSGGGEQ